ncbi:MAG: threonine dehydratase [Myxococcales bacterium]|nr:threonine dehydratase [Myxococcales bacterium]
MELPSRAAIEAAAAIVYRHMPPTPQYSWPLLCRRVGARVWVKHENHTPVGAFKLRGGLVFMEGLRDRRVAGVAAATKGNHGQSVTCAARALGLPAVIVVPEGNSVEKNAAMAAQGAELVIHGDDFQDALEHLETLTAARGLVRVPSFAPALVAGVATYSVELLSARPDLEVVYVPIGLGSGICGMIAAREALGRRVEIVGVVSAGAPALARSVEQGRLCSAPVTTTLADGMACRRPDEAALALIERWVDRLVIVTDEEVAAAMRALFVDTHNVAEGAGAAAVAAALQERRALAGREVGVVLSGGNVDADVFARVLAPSSRAG